MKPLTCPVPFGTLDAVATPEQILAQVERIAASEGFRASPRLERFLRFVVEKSMNGQAEQIKEYLLGSEVFDRGADFDPRLDPIVRVEARRFRAKLDEYYEGPGQADPVRIVLPKGSYVPAFESATKTAAPAPPHVSRRWWIGGGLLAAGAAVVLVSGTQSAPHVVAVIPQGEEKEFAEGLAEAVAAELARGRQAKVVAWPLMVEYRTKHDDYSEQPTQTARDLGANTILATFVRRNGDQLRIAAILTRPDQGFKDWVGEYDRTAGDAFALQRELAHIIADEAGRALARL